MTDKVKKGKKAGVKIPKKIGTVKVPKELRRTGNAMLARAQTAEGRDAIASGLAMAATAVAATVAANRARAHSAKAAASAPGDTVAVPVMIDPQQVAEAVGSAAKAVMARMFAGPAAGT